MQEDAGELANARGNRSIGAGFGIGVMNRPQTSKRVRWTTALMSEDKEIPRRPELRLRSTTPVRKLETSNKEKMAGLTPGHNLPDGFKMRSELLNFFAQGCLMSFFQAL